MKWGWWPNFNSFNPYSFFAKVEVRTYLNVLVLHATGVERPSSSFVCKSILYKYTGGNGEVFLFLFVSGRFQNYICFFMPKLWSFKSINILHIPTYTHNMHSSEKLNSHNIVENIDLSCFIHFVYILQKHFFVWEKWAKSKLTCKLRTML